MKKKGLIVLLAFIVAISFMPVCAFAGTKTVQAKSYYLIKSGKTVYCSGNSGVYKVTLKKGKIKKKKRLAKPDEYVFYEQMQKKGKYLYFIIGTNGSSSHISRVRTSGGKVRHLAFVDELEDFAVKGKKIYYDYGYEDDNGNMQRICRSMKLNGKKKRKTSVRPVERILNSNAQGYSILRKETEMYYYDYLKTPKGTFLLGKTLTEDYYYED